MEDVDESAMVPEELIDANENNDTILRKCLPVLQGFVMERLKITLEDAFKHSVDLTGWKATISKRVSGLTLGLIEVDYFNSDNKKCRSRAEVVTHLGLAPAVKKTAKGMLRELYYVAAMEYREEMLLSQKLSLYGFYCEEVKYSDDNVFLLPIKHDLDRTGFFCLGNLTVISWGRIINYDGFHNSHGIFPLGFRCLRQEHDVFLDSVIDCLLEIDAICTNDDGHSFVYSALPPEENDLRSFDSVEVLFRISVQWILPNGSRVVKVYEGKNPQHVWQAVKLETIGLDAELPTSWLLTKVEGMNESCRRISCVNADEVNSYVLRALIDIDDEEMTLRVTLNEELKRYMKALKTEQSKGTLEPMKPRIIVDNADNFVDDALMRIIEGMTGSIACEKYVFYEAREKESGARALWKEYGLLQKKMKGLDQVIRKNSIQAEQKQLLGSKQRNDSTENDLGVKDIKALIQMAQKVRNNKTRDIEKGIAALKNSMSKQWRRRRDDVKSVLKKIAENDAMSKELKEEQSKVPSVNELSLSTPRPRPFNSGEISLQGSLFSQLLGLWVYLNTVSTTSTTAKSFSLEELTNALTYSHPILKEVSKRMYSRLATASIDSGVNKFGGNKKPETTLNTIGVELTKMLANDFERNMGMESAEALLGGLHIPVNALTWREITRLTLLAKLSREFVGITENETNALIKGRGFTTSPDSVDRKALKLARRRILLHYYMRHEVQETMQGFRWGLCVRVPVPCGLYSADNRYWLFFYQLISNLEYSDAWILSKLLDCAKFLRMPSQDIMMQFLACLKEVNLSKVATEETFIDFKDKVLRIMKHCSESLKNTGLAIAVVTVHSKNLVLYIRNLTENALSMEIKAKLDEENALAAAAAAAVDVGDEEGNLGTSALMQDNDQMNENANDADSQLAMDVEVKVEEDDIGQADNLSTAMKRCYFALRCLMEHAEGAMLSYISSPLWYRRRARYWATLKDVRKNLVEGSYQDSIERFYRDVIFVIELSQMCNLDNPNNRGILNKLHIVFERLFFEMVIHCEDPLSFPDCCHYCRNIEPVPSLKAAVCDRCEGVYHIDCLDPPLMLPPRSDWTCPACVEQRWIAQAHPFRLAKVAHPDNADLHGEVVAIEPCNGDILFVLDFKATRELWSPNKVRFYALPAEEGSSYDLPSGYRYEDYEKVCGICKAYTGYGSTFNVIPAILTDLYSKHADRVSQKDADFDTIRLGLGLLSLEDYHTEEWVALFQSLLVTILRSPFHPLNIPFAEEMNEIVKKSLDDLKKAEESDDDLDFTDDDNDMSSEDESLQSLDNDIGRDSSEKLKSVDISRVQSPAMSEVSGELVADNSNSPNVMKGGELKSSEEAWLWKLKGLEDALQCNEIVQEALATIDLEFKAGLEVEESQPMIKEHLGDFLPVAIATVVKSCTVKPAENADTDSWTEGWSQAMDRINADTSPFSLLCVLCNNSEEYLCSPMVFLPDQSILSSKGSIEWEVVDYNKVVEEGVRIAHCYCAQTLHTLLSSKKAVETYDPEDFAVVERLCAVDSPCIVPLGSDRNRSVYYVFPNTPYVFVQSELSASHLGESLVQPCYWQVYKTDEEKAKLINWLQPGHKGENRLRRVLVFLNQHWEVYLDAMSGEVESEEANGALSKNGALIKKRKVKFAVNDRVYVNNNAEPPFYWPAEIVSIEAREDQSPVYKVSYDDWDENYDAFLTEEQIISEEEYLKRMNGQAEDSAYKVEAALAASKKAFQRKLVFTAPDVLFTLQACLFVRIADRECGQRPPMGFSSCQSPLEQLRAAMLIIEAALPCGALDESEDRWADNFVIAWREALMAASDAVSLMQCQVMLEYGIRTSWLKQPGLKMFSCLPSRQQCLKNATYSMVAVRIWVLDMTIKYDKVQSEKREKTKDISLGSASKKKKYK